MSTIIVTGGAGFIGSAVIRHILTQTDARVVNLDKLTYAANLDSLAALSDTDRYSFEQADITDRAAMDRIFTAYQPDAIMHLAAESHVDRSIDGPAAFIQTNIIGTFTLLEAALAFWRTLPSDKQAAFRFHHISTDEVFGTLGEEGLFTEATPYAPNSPYSASKASSDHLVRAWHHTYKLPVVTSNCSNNYGPWQFPEKLIPLMIINALKGKPLPVYGQGTNVRDWLHVEDHARALWTILTTGVPGESYNDRPGHDARYAIDASKIKAELAWEPQETFDSGLESTVRWYLDHPEWWEKLANVYAGDRLGLKKAAS